GGPISGGGPGNPPSGPPSSPPPPPAPAATLQIAPTSAALHGGDALQFTAFVSNLDNKSVTWSVGGVAGGNTTLGTIDAKGLYKAPLAIPNPNPVQVTATSVAKPSLTASGAVTVSSAVPVLSVVTPDSFQSPANFTLVLTGRNFVNGVVAVW